VAETSAKKSLRPHKQRRLQGKFGGGSLVKLDKKWQSGKRENLAGTNYSVNRQTFSRGETFWRDGRKIILGPGNSGPGPNQVNFCKTNIFTSTPTLLMVSKFVQRVML